MMLNYIQNENPAGDSLAPLGKNIFKGTPWDDINFRF